MTDEHPPVDHTFYGVAGFAQEDNEVVEVHMVKTSPGGTPERQKLGEDRLVSGDDRVLGEGVPVGLAYSGGTLYEDGEVSVHCIYYDDEDDEWWMVDGGTMPTEDIYE